MACQKLQVLGAGSHGTVFLAQFSSSRFRVPAELAVKSSELEFSDSLRVEGRILSELRGCPYIIQCFGDDTSVEHEKSVYNLLLEYAPGGSLQSLIKSRGGFIPENEVSFYAYQLLKGIHDVHRRGLVHCDLKPDNVLLFPCKCGCGVTHLKIADFGLAKVAGKNVFGDCHRGTLLYTSPESLFCGMHEAPKDIWAIGCMVVEMITGKSPWRFCNSKDDELALNMAFNQPEIPKRISDHGKDFLKRCFERNPNARWTADKLLNHPFVANKYNLQMGQKWEDPQALVNRLFGNEGWSSSTGLFSTPIPACTSGRRRPATSPCFNHYVLFEERLKKILHCG